MSAIVGGRPRIFLSYRREDSSGHAGRLHDDLTRRFGEDAVFIDVDAIPLGQDFVQVINDRLQQSKVLLVVIGRQWLTATDATGRRRLDDPADFVRLEISAALAQQVRVIPVLVGGAAMPTAGQLPAGLAPLARCQAFTLSDQGWRRDITGLAAAVQPPPPAWLKILRFLLRGAGRHPRPTAAVLGAVALAVALLVLLSGSPPPPRHRPANPPRFSFSATHVACGSGCTASISAAKAGATTLTVSYDSRGAEPTQPCIQVDGGSYLLSALEVDTVVADPPTYSGTIVFPFVLAGSYAFQFACHQSTPAALGRARLHVLGVSRYQPDASYFAVVQRVARARGGLLLDFAVVAPSAGVDSPSSSCLERADGTHESPSSVETAQQGSEGLLITGTMTFASRSAGNFVYGCTPAYSAVPLG